MSNHTVPTFKEYIKEIFVVTSGSGYSEPPTLIIPPPDRSNDEPVQAVAEVVVTGGSITEVNIIEDGDGYIEAPVPYVVGFPTDYSLISDPSTEIDAGTYIGIPTTTDSADGSGLTVNITVDEFGYSTFSTNDDGNALYREGDRITIDPIEMGGMEDDPEIIASIVKINNGSGATFSTEIDKVFKNYVYAQPKISPFVGEQIPEVLQEEFPLFKTLFEKYYEFMEQTNSIDNTKHGPLKVLQDFLSKLDVDFNDDGSINTDDNFIREFFHDYAKDFPLNQAAKLSRVIKDINSFYTAKGSVEATKYLFKVLYNENVSLRNSGQFVLRPSSNRWRQDYVVKVYEAQVPNVDDLQGKRIDIHYAVSEGAATNYYKKTTTVQRVKKISYTSPQVYELTLDLPATFDIVGPGVGQSGYDEQLLAYVSGEISTITGTGSNGSFENPSSSVVDGIYTVTDADYESYLDVEYTNNTVYEVGTYVKANSKIYVTVNEGTTDSVGTGPTHESGDELNGTSKFRFVSFDSHKTTDSSGGEFTVVISGNSVSNITVVDNGTNFQPNEIIEIPTTFFGGSGTPSVKFKVDQISSGKIDNVLILDGGTGFSANPSVTIRPNSLDTISSNAVIDTRLTDGTITSTVFVANQQGRGYNNRPDLAINVASILTYITLEGESGFFNIRAYPSRVLNSASFNSIAEGSSTTNGGFKVGQTFKISETGDILGVYAIDYFAEDYTLTGIDNKGYIKISKVDSNGYPSAFDIIAVGVGFFRADFQFNITSNTGNTCVIDLTTGFNALLAGVYEDAGSFLSDANRLFDNRIYQNFSYEIESERPQSEWNDYVRRAAHPIGFGLFGNLQIRQSVDLSGNFNVETDVYMFFKYPDIETVLISDEDVTRDFSKNDVIESIFPGDGFADRQNIASVVNKLDIHAVRSDGVGANSEFGPYTFQGTEVENFYATSDGSTLGDPYFFRYPNENDDYVERLQTGDYFLEDYVLLGNPYKDIEMVFDSTNVGGYATDYFLEDYVQFLNQDPERGTELFQINDVITSLNVEIEVTGGASAVDTLYATSDGTALGDPYFFQHANPDDDYVRRTLPSGETILIDDSLVLSFVFFRNPSDSVELDDTSILFERGRLVDDSVTMEDDAVELFKEKLQENRVAVIQDLSIESFGKNLTDTFDVDDSTSFDITTIQSDSLRVLQTVSIEAQPTLSDAFSTADTIDGLNIGVIPAQTFSAGDSINNFDITTLSTDTIGLNDLTAFESTNTKSDIFNVDDEGSLISQSFTVDLTYFAEDYVADTVVNF